MKILSFPLPNPIPLTSVICSFLLEYFFNVQKYILCIKLDKKDKFIQCSKNWFFTQKNWADVQTLIWLMCFLTLGTKPFFLGASNNYYNYWWEQADYYEWSPGWGKFYSYQHRLCSSRWKIVICVYCRILNIFSRFDYLMQLRVTYLPGLTDFSVCSTDRQIFLNRNPFCEKLLSLPPVSSCMCIFEFMWGW